MDLKELIQELKRREIEISFFHGKLKYSGPEDNITPEIIDELKNNKGKLIKYFWPKELALMMPINTEGSKIPLFIVHGDYANYAISDHLGKDQPIYGFFHPGSEGEAISYKDVKEMARVYYEQVKVVYPSGPFYLMGFSFGGTLAFEMAVQMRKDGFNVPVLILLDSISPLAREPFKRHGSLLKTLRKNFPLIRIFKRKLKQWVNESYILRNMPIPVERRADYISLKYSALTERYKPEKYHGNILLFRTKENTSSFEYLGWETLADNIKVVHVKGGHLEIFNDSENTIIVQSEIENVLASASY